MQTVTNYENIKSKLFNANIIVAVAFFVSYFVSISLYTIHNLIDAIYEISFNYHSYRDITRIIIILLVFMAVRKYKFLIRMYKYKLSYIGSAFLLLANFFTFLIFFITFVSHFEIPIGAELSRIIETAIKIYEVCFPDCIAFYMMSFILVLMSVDIVKNEKIVFNSIIIRKDSIKKEYEQYSLFFLINVALTISFIKGSLFPRYISEYTSYLYEINKKMPYAHIVNYTIKYIIFFGLIYFLLRFFSVNITAKNNSKKITKISCFLLFLSNLIFILSLISIVFASLIQGGGASFLLRMILPFFIIPAKGILVIVTLLSLFSCKFSLDGIKKFYAIDFAIIFMIAIFSVFSIAVIAFHMIS